MSGKVLSLTLVLLIVTIVNGYWNKHMEVDGLFEGDIQATPEQLDRLQKGTNGFGSIIGKRWPNPQRIPYTIETSIGATGRAVILDAIAEYHNHTCLRFVQKAFREVSFISFYAGKGCHSPVGKSGVNRISLQYPECQDKGTIMHEIGHSIGILHEQSRPDRDQYIKINLNAVFNPKMSYNFNKGSNVNSLGTPYDYSSMMQYGSSAFARPGMKTIISIDSSKQHLLDSINNVIGFSKIDVQQINLMYNCANIGGRSTGGSNNNHCQDNNINCILWKSQGHCTNIIYNKGMQINCCKSCQSTF